MNVTRIALATLALTASTLASAGVVNQLQADFGVISPLPYSRHFGDTFTAIAGTAGYTTEASSGTVTTTGSIDGSTINRPLVTQPGNADFNFYDDYVFTMPGEAGALTASAVSVNFGSLLGIKSLQARLYAIPSEGLTTGALLGSAVYAWTTVTDLSGASVAVTAFNTPITLVDGVRYALEIRGLAFGPQASYGGNLNVSPVPEADGLVLALAGLGVAGWVASRRRVTA